MKSQAFFMTKGCVEVIQTNFKFKLLPPGDEKLDISTKLGKAKKSAKTKNVNAMAYINQCLSKCNIYCS